MSCYDSFAMNGARKTRISRRDHAYWLQKDLNAALAHLSTSYEEILSLRKKNTLLLTENATSSNCPHGRPTTLQISTRDLAKQFKRE